MKAAIAIAVTLTTVGVAQADRREASLHAHAVGSLLSLGTSGTDQVASAPAFGAPVSPEVTAECNPLTPPPCHRDIRRDACTASHQQAMKGEHHVTVVWRAAM